MNNIQQLALELVAKNLSNETSIEFKDNWFTFYYDPNGQRGHRVFPYNPYGRTVKDCYVIKRILSFENPIDEGKNGAILGVISLDKCKAVSIKEDKIEFDNFTIYLTGNPFAHKPNPKEDDK